MNRNCSRLINLKGGEIWNMKENFSALYETSEQELRELIGGQNSVSITTIPITNHVCPTITVGCACPQRQV